MAGLIKAEDIAAVKDKSNLEDIVSEHVTLRRAGPGSLKGLCPFHDEKTPSFHVRPAMGSYHCFGCGEGGDVIAFVMAVEHLSFTEAVERLAAKVGIELRYEDGGPQRERIGLGARGRLLEAHRTAEEFYAEALLRSGEGRKGRDMLRDKGFDSKAAQHFMVGYAPRGGNALHEHLKGKGFTDDELVTSGLCARSSRGLYDRFRGRLMWPIRDITGDTVGFGARRLYDDDRVAAKYLNTSETPIYKKTHLLYGLDLAKKEIAAQRKAVVVEGYTDVMACHLSGVPTAVATCGTAFGSDHIRVLRRLIRDSKTARVIFTFDGDAAGQKAAMRTFADEGEWEAKLYVATAPGGQDPNDLRLSGGDAAVQGLVNSAVSIHQFAITTLLEEFDLASPEGRSLATIEVAPVIKAIREPTLRDQYARAAAGQIGVPLEVLLAEVARSSNRPQRRAPQRDKPRPQESAPQEPPRFPAPDLRNPMVQAERQLLQLALQHPSLVADDHDRIDRDAVSAPAHREIVAAMTASGGVAEAAKLSTAAWVDRVAEAAPEELRGLVREMAVAPLPVRLDPNTGRPPARYAQGLVDSVHRAGLQRRIQELFGWLSRAGEDHPQRAEGQRRLWALQQELKNFTGGD